MNYPHIFERVYCEPLCISKQRFDAIHAVLFPRLVNAKTGSEMVINLEPSAAKPSQNIYDGKRHQKARASVDYRTGKVDGDLYTSPKDGVAVVPIYGILAKNVSAFEESCGGGTDIAPIAHALNQAVANKDIKTIVLDISSPGGSVTGIEELGNSVRAATKVKGKTVYAFTDYQMCSAAYWIGSQADEVYATPSAQLGSIGTYLAWLDQTVAMQLQGLKLELFAAGDHKGMGLPGRPLTQADRVLLQAQVDQINNSFTSAVVAARPKVKKETMQGQTFRGADNVRNGLCDGLLNDWDELMSLL